MAGGFTLGAANPKALRKDEKVPPGAVVLTLVPASYWGFADRGLVREGMAADLVVFDPDTIAHCREFLDSVKSRKRPSGDVEIGYHSTLPTLLGIHAIREGRTFKYDAAAHKAIAI